MLFLNRKHCCFGGSIPIGLTFYLVVALEAHLISLKMFTLRYLVLQTVTANLLAPLGNQIAQ